jgi:glycosyltransferase involved in cell wall biosynthesis
MKILFCNKYNFPFSGTEVYLFELMELLQSHGHEVALFSAANAHGAHSQFEEHLVPHIDFKTARGFWLRTKLAAHAIYSHQVREELRKVLAAFRPDVAHVRNIYHHLSPSIFWELRSQSVPVLYHLNDFKITCPSYNLVAHGRHCDRCRGGHFWHVLTSGCYKGRGGSSAVLAAEAYLHKLLGTYIKCVDRFLAPSHFVRNKLIKNGFDGGKIDVLYHFQRLPEQAPPEAEGGAPILYFGRLSSEKGLIDLLYAMRTLPQVRLQIAGDGPQRTELERTAEELRLGNVQFLGHLPSTALQESIAFARFTVLPSLAYETLGKTILESYAQSRPVLATDLGSRRELVLDGKTGLLYPPGDRNRLAATIAYLYGHPRLAARMGAAGRELVRTQHSPEKHYEALMSLYADLARSTSIQALPTPGEQPKCRVAFIGGRGVVSKYSGIETYYEQVGWRLAEKGHDVTIYCRSYFTPAVTQDRGARIVRLPTLRTKHLDTLVHTMLSTIHAMFCNYDIVHYHALGPALFSFLPRTCGKKTVVTVQGLDWQRKKWGRLASSFLRLGERAAVSFPNGTMVVSRTLQEYYRARYGAETSYVPNGTEVRGLRLVRHLPKWGLETGNYVLFLGRFSPEKNCHLLIRAYERIETSVKLVLAGGSSYSSEYVHELRRHASDRIRVLDWISGEALEELLANAMIFVLPSDLEGLSLALLDAMGAGLCVLASDVPENRELVDGAGFTFRRRDDQDLERMLRRLINEESARKEAGRRAQERVRERYLWPGIVDSIEQEYCRVLGWKPASQPEFASPQHQERHIA